MNFIVDAIGRSGLLRRDLDYHLLRASMVIIFAWFGYDKWFESEIKGLVPLITHGPFIFWTIPVLGIGGTSVLLGASEWTFGSLLLLGYWNKKLGVLGALGSCCTFIATFTILPFAPDAWDPGAGGFPAMGIVAAFLLKDLVLLTVSVYLLKQDVQRVIAAREKPTLARERSALSATN
ncbi:putative membrane protein YkgB [Bradyrhizobium sp. i1.4.4]|uniref:YkgB family protein n=1 Tax=unclassified Bradyrhizobium TaxID=2631580 RepID=UPI0033982BDF